MRMVRSFAACLIALASALAQAPPANAAHAGTQLTYEIDTASDPKTLGFVELVSSTPGESISLLHPLGKGFAQGMADYGVLQAFARLDPDFVTDQASWVEARAEFLDELTILGSNPGAAANVRFTLRVTGSIRQPFLVSEVTGYAMARASLAASSDHGADAADQSFDAQGPEPVHTSYDTVLSVFVPFEVGGTVVLNAHVEAFAEALDLVVDPGQSDFIADFANQATLLGVLLSGVTDPVIVSSSNTNYTIGTVSVPELRADGLALSRPRPEPSTGPVHAELALPRRTHVRARIIDVAGRAVRVLADHEFAAGLHGITWDGRDASGAAAAPGVYRLIAQSPLGTASRRIVRLR